MAEGSSLRTPAAQGSSAGAPRLRNVGIPLLLFAVAAAVHIGSNPRPPGWYKHYVYQAVAFGQGRLDVRGVPDFYQDLSPFEGRVYLPFPPAPALVLMPAVALWAEATDQTRVAQLLGAVNVALMWALLVRLGFPAPVALFGAVLLGFGTVHWSAATIGTTWFFAHVCAVFFVLLAWLEIEGRGRGWLAGVWFALAWLSRVPVLLALPAAAWRLRRLGDDRVWWFAAANLAGLILFFLYNAARFGDPLETGISMHTHAAHFTEPLRQGILSVAHLGRNLHTMWLRGFEVIGSAPFLRPSAEGLSVFLTTPALVRVFAPLTPYRSCHRILVAAIALVMLPSLFWFSTGWVQWGYRYSLDWMPLAVVLLALCLRPAPTGLDWALLGLSVASNALGAYWIRVLGW
ncbi:MAG: hypothetical protein QN163_00090 [Armatimonadota bacterium]|nr:hypothetical protein [Armatimonadota bacterium]MDR5696794.1 hypothetical protein [Armatimonadota bacterium]